MSNPDNQSAEPLVEPLTRREREILALLAQGYSAPEIAENLTVAVSSVKTHIQHLYGKLGVRGRRPAVARARALGLLDPLSAAAPFQPPPSLHGVIGPTAFQRGPSPFTQPGRSDNLPVQVTRFFGREAEIAQLKERLTEHRLVTLTGSGGVGKTRLSLRVAEELPDDFPDGVWLVELAPLTNAALVPQQVAAALGLRENPGQPILAMLASSLRDRRVLLLLDNCEHLLEACAGLADTLLRAGPRLKIMASSREPLGVPGEAVFPIPQLAFPDPGQVVTPDSIGEYASIRLFLDRARLVLPGYEPTARDAASLANIVQRLDGIPLAIEMAAARLNILTADQLASRLDDVFRVLTGGSRTALPRQQTLRATLDWSYKLLNEPERLLLRRLSVFAGGCTLEAAEAVCADAPGEGLEAGEVLERLGALVAKSMVMAGRQPGQGVRYHLLETVRQYAREKLQDAGEGARLRTRQRDYFLTLADARGSARGSIAWPVLAAKLAAEIDNLRLALEWSFSDQTVLEAAPRLVLGSLFLWPSSVELIDWIKRGVAWCQSHPEVSARLFASLLTFASPALAQDDPQTAITWLKQAVEISRGLGPDGKESLMTGLSNLAWITMHDLDDVEGALAPFSEWEALMLELGSNPDAPKEYLRRMAGLTATKADIALKQGRYQDAKWHAAEGVRLYQEIGDWWGAGKALISLADARENLGDYAQARDDLLQAMNLLGDEPGYMRQNHESNLLRLLGVVDFQQGYLDRAYEFCQDSLRLANRIPDYNILASCLALAAGIAAKRGQPARSAKLSGAAQAMYARQRRKPWEDSSLDTLLPGWRDVPEQPAISKAFEAGQAMSAEQAVVLALSETGD